VSQRSLSVFFGARSTCGVVIAPENREQVGQPAPENREQVGQPAGRRHP
jgi:hypothetical protein